MQIDRRAPLQVAVVHARLAHALHGHEAGNLGRRRCLMSRLYSSGISEWKIGEPLWHVSGVRVALSRKERFARINR